MMHFMHKYMVVIKMGEVVVKSNLPQVKAELANRISAILEALGVEAEGNAVTEVNKLVYDTPPSDSYIRTGRLKNSITHAVLDNSAYIGTNLEYAPYVELGTSRMNPRPFLKNGIINYQDDYKRIVELGLKEGGQ